MSEYKAKRCNSCKQFRSDLIQLPFGSLICDICMDMKCGWRENNRQDEIDPFSVIFGRENRPNPVLEDDNEAKACRIKSRLNEFRADLGSYSEHVKRVVDKVRYEVELSFEIAKSRAEKRTFEKLNQIEFEYEEKAAKNERVLAEINGFISELRQTDELKNESQFKEFKSKVRRRLFEFEMSLDQSATCNTTTLEVRENVGRKQAILGFLKTTSTQDDKKKSTKLSFSIESILGL